MQEVKKTMKTITIGDWDGEQKQINVEDTTTLQEAMQIAGIRQARTQQITTFSNADRVEPGEVVSDGETYLLTGNQVSA